MIEPWRAAARARRVMPWIFVLLYVFALTVGAFVGGLWAASGIGGGLVVFLAAWMADGRPPRPAWGVAAFVLMFLGTALALNFRSVVPAVSWHLLFQQTTIMVPLAVFSSPEVQAKIDPRRLWPIVALAAAFGALALGLELLAGAPLLHLVRTHARDITGYNRGVSYLTVFAFPVAAFLWTSGRRWQAVGFLCVMIVPTEWTESRATRMALYLGVLATLTAYVAPRLTRWVLTLLLGCAFFMPFAVTSAFLRDQAWIRRLPPSWQHRTEIWDYMSYRIFDRPLLGWGFGTSRLLDYQHPHGASYVWITEAAGHPHDSVLQLWVELGLPGLLLGLGFAAWALWSCERLPRRLAPFATGAWVAALIVSLVAYNFWDDSQFALFALTMLAFKSLARLSPQNGRDGMDHPGGRS